ncbi:hypothetical protein [Leptospira santarosai]|uniref:Uncharacterized protein n=1 Tax=Leptospira santarosai TaxID=28183 RepID=A0AB73MQK5_9LEPT|nr:hypothetical protein [Leptospira santarosai]ONF93009.1 hypothetical protein BWD14_09295 [Leptospira santarosai]
MLSPSDKEYIQTKKIKQGLSSLKQDFFEIALWISKEFNVKVINVFLDDVNTNHSKRPRLYVILENTSDYNKFYRSPFIHDSKKTKRILNHFLNIYNASPLINERDLFISFGDFEKIAIDECVLKISTNEIEAIKNIIGRLTTNFSSYITIFFYEERHIKTENVEEIKEVVRKGYYEVLKKHDEFDYLTVDKLNINLDSKENFDNNFQSSWFYYYR